MRKSREFEDEANARLAAGVAAYALSAPIDEIMREPRGSAPAALARQVAMYLCHVAFGMSLARVAAAFGRDRSTAAYACHAIEDKREDGAFDAWVEELEHMLRAAPAPWRPSFLPELRP